jgi:hypothetical protein
MTQVCGIYQMKIFYFFVRQIETMIEKKAASNSNLVENQNSVPAQHQKNLINHSQHYSNYLNSNEFGIFMANHTTPASAAKQSATNSINIVFETKIKIIDILQVRSKR